MYDLFRAESQEVPISSAQLTFTPPKEIITRERPVVPVKSPVQEVKSQTLSTAEKSTTSSYIREKAPARTAVGEDVPRSSVAERKPVPYSVQLSSRAASRSSSPKQESQHMPNNNDHTQLEKDQCSAVRSNSEYIPSVPSRLEQDDQLILQRALDLTTMLRFTPCFQFILLITCICAA